MEIRFQNSPADEVMRQKCDHFVITSAKFLEKFPGVATGILRAGGGSDLITTRGKAKPKLDSSLESATVVAIRTNLGTITSVNANEHKKDENSS